VSKLSGLQWLALGLIVGLLALTTLGGAVRVTDSGLACPDWPLCYGQVLPTGDHPPYAAYQVWLEWTHRLAASLIGLAVIAYAALTWLRLRARPLIWVPAVSAVALLGVQVALGALTVTEELEAAIVTAHLAVAMLIVMLISASAAALIAAPAAAGPSAAAPPRDLGAAPDPAAFARLALLAGLSVYALVVLGSYVTHTEAGYFCGNQWPLCNGDLWPDSPKAQLHVSHRLLAVAAGGLVAAVSVQAVRQAPRSRAVIALAHGASTLFLIQVIIGALTMWLALADWVRVMHLSVGALVWALVSAAAALAASRAARPGLARRSAALSCVRSAQTAGRKPVLAAARGDRVHRCLPPPGRPARRTAPFLRVSDQGVQHRIPVRAAAPADRWSAGAESA